MGSYRLTNQAEIEFEQIMDHTYDQFGNAQMEKYGLQLIKCFEGLTKAKGSYKRSKRKEKTLRSVHCQKHYVFALEGENNAVLIIALFHERMDIVNRLRDRLKSF